MIYIMIFIIGFTGISKSNVYLYNIIYTAEVHIGQDAS